MRVIVWAKATEVEGKSIKMVHHHCPQISYESYVQISMDINTYVAIKDNEGWQKEQYNRNREFKDEIK